MEAEEVSRHFKRYLGTDVDVSFGNDRDIRWIVLYRHDRLADGFVRSAYQALGRENPSLAGAIEKLIVSCETNTGRWSSAVSIGTMGRTDKAT